VPEQLLAPGSELAIGTHIAIERLARDAELSAQGIDRHLTILHADCILTGLPFSTLEAGEADAIMRETASALAPGGLLAAYQMRTAVRPLIDRYFAAVRHGYEWWNLPPCHLYWAKGPRRRS